MKHIFTLVTIFLAFSLAAQTTQKGVVKEYNEKAQKTPLTGVELNVRAAGSTVSDNTGKFSLQFQTLKPGEKVNVRRIEKLGYEVFNKEAIEQWNLNPNTPFVIVMCRSDRFKKIRDNYEKVSSESYARQLKKEEAALLKLKEQGKLKEAEYQKQLFELRENYENQLDNLENYVDRFSRIDLSELSAEEQEIIALVQEGRIEEAIAKYEDQNYIDKYIKEVGEIKEISSAIDQLSEVKQSKIESKDSLLAAVQRQIETLKLAGGKENFDKIGIILKELVDADSTDINIVLKYIDFCMEQNRIEESTDLLQKLQLQPLTNNQLFKVKNYIAAIKKENRDLSGAIAEYQLCDSIARLNLDKRQEATSLHNIGTVKMEMEHFDEGLAFLMTALNIRDSLVNISSDDDLKLELSTTLANIARTYEGKKDISKVNEYYNKAINIQIDLFQSSQKKYGLKLANTYNSVAAMNHDCKNYSEAKNYYQNAIEIISPLFDTNPESYAEVYGMTYGNYASLMTDMGKYEESIEFFDKAQNAYDILKSIAPSKILRPLAMLKVNLSNVYVNTNRLEEASNELENAIRLFETLAQLEENDYSKELILTNSNYAVVLIDMNRIDEAEQIYLKAYQLCLQSNVDSDLSTTISKGRTYFSLGNFYSVYKQDQNTAKRYFNEALDLFGQYVDNVPLLQAYIAMVLNGRAYANLFAGDLDNAIKDIDKAIESCNNDINFYDSKCEILVNCSKINEAKQLLDEIAEKFPDIDIKRLPSYSLVFGSNE